MRFRLLPDDTELNRMVNDFAASRQQPTKAAAPAADRQPMTTAELHHAVTNFLAPLAQRQAYAAAKGQVETVRRSDGPIRIIQPGIKPRP
ncbi:MAG: hypothetical protein AB7Q01_13685 [Gammaproteobacteria bacterium]